MTTLVTPHLPSADPGTPPGNRWNPWPMGLGVFFAVLIATIASFIVFAVRQNMDLVRPDYYEQELRHTRQMERVRRTQALAPGASLSASPEGLRILLPPGHSGERFSGTLRLYRPSDAALDRLIPLTPDADGRQSVPVEDLRPGLWRAQANWSLDGVEFYLESAVVVPGTPGKP